MKKKVLSAILALAMVFTLLIMPGVKPTKADDLKEVKYATSKVISRGNPYIYVDLGKKWDGNKKLTVKSSNNRVIKPEGDGYPVLNLKRAGTATVTFKTGGKSYKMKFKVLAYKNPVKLFSVGGKKIAGKFKSSSTAWLKYTGSKPTIKVTPNKGWKLKSIKYEAYKYDEATDTYTRYVKTVKNKTSVKLKGSSWDSYIVVKLYNSNKKLTETLKLYLNR